MTTDSRGRSIDLAHSAPFHLGSAKVVPPTGEVIWGDDRDTLQPRVMQVLVALASCRGEVVSHDDLVATCWDGRIVGDDAIQRCIGRIRRLAERTGSFTVETIPRIGYRLEVVGEAEQTSRRRGFGTVLAGLIVVVLAPLAVIGFRIWHAPSAPLRIQVMALRPIGAGAATTFARTLQDDISAVLNQSGVQTADPPGGSVEPARRADLVLKGSVVATGPLLEVRIFLEDVRSGLTLWSGHFKEEASSADLLADQVAVAATETVYTVLEPNQQKGLRLDPEILALFIRGSDLVRSPQFLHEGEPREIFERIVARAPDFAGGHAVLAVTLVNEARHGTPSARPPLLARARREANIAIGIDPYAAGAAYDALYLAERTREPRAVVRAERWLLEGLRRAPDFPYLSMRECRLLTEVGRAADAIPYCQRALALRPLAGPIGYSYARALNLAGRHELAEQAIERATRYNPNHASTRMVRFEIAAFVGSPERAAVLLHDLAMRPPGLGENAVAALDAYLVARRTGQRTDIERAAMALRVATLSGGLDINIAVKALATLGRVDDAYDMLLLPELDSILFTTGASFLLEPATAPLRTDVRFWPMTGELGLAQYWSAHDKWPDFCGREVALVICKAETTRVLTTLKPESVK
jgi:DNA-binding winged helix-turn-helix (wHTH) protein/tetratricopeptide (TPR) repeat protein